MANDSGVESPHVTAAELAKRLGVTRASILRRIKKEGVQAVEVERVTPKGMRKLVAVPAAYAAELEARYAAARVGA